MSRHIVMFSGGVGSWAAARRIVDEHGPDNVICLFTDVLGEDEDTYRFIDDAIADLGCEYLRLADGRDIWQVFKDRKFLGNSRQANCSAELKQKPAREWLKANGDPERDVIVIGIDWTETHRIPAVERAYAPYRVEFPMTEYPLMSKATMIALAERRGLTPPRLYSMGFSHNNCGGGCVRAGQAQFTHLLRVMPERFAQWEANEADVAAHLGKDVAILSETVNGQKRLLPLTVLRQRVESQPSLLDPDDWGGCGCFVDYEETR
jgi:hypothetical protein